MPSCCSSVGISASVKSPLSGAIRPGRHGARAGEPGLVYREVRRSLYSISPGRDRAGAVSDLLRERMGLPLPPVGRFETNGDTSLIWSSVNQWMLAGPPNRPGDSLRAVRDLLAGNAAVVDHSDARTIVRINGPAVRRVIARLCAVDLHPSRFEPGHCAATRMAHVGALLQQLDDAPTFEIHVFRAFAVSFLDELREAAAEFGHEGEIVS